MDGLYRIGVKVYCTKGQDMSLEEFIPVFHRWVQQKRTSSVLIDVADYSHVPEGPGILLVAHEGNFAVDESLGRRGFTMYRKRPLDGTFAERLSSVARHTVAAAIALTREPEFANRLGFSGREMTVYFNDRLLAPNSEDAFLAVRGEVERFFEAAFGSKTIEYARQTDTRARLTVTARAADAESDIERLAARIGV